MGKLLDDAKNSVRTLNKIFFGAILTIILLILLMIVVATFQLAFGNIPIYSFVAINLILIWLGLLIGYLAWAVYFYNINLGLTNESWAELKEKQISEDESVKLDKTIDRKYSGPTDNLYQSESLGLPPGTIRGSIALTLMIGGLALFIYSMGSSSIQEGNSFIYDNFEFFKTAFLMMIAFYFGSKSLEILQKKGGIIQKRFNETNSGNSDTPLLSQDSVPSPVSEFDQMDNKAPEVRNIVKQVVPDTSILEEAEPIQTVSIQDNNLTIGHKMLDNDDIEEECKILNLEPAAMQSVIKVESGGSGFLANGQPKILFEGHIFWKHLAKKKADGLIPEGPEYYAPNYPDIVYQNWTKQYYLGKEKEYLRLDKAILIDRDSAYKATSWGKFQILGENFEAAGFKGKTISDFVEAHKKSEQEHLKAFISFISNTVYKGKSLFSYLQAKDWASFARAYNGPGYATNKYDVNLEQAYHDFSIRMNSNITATLTRKEFEPKQILGDFVATENDTVIFSCKTLELPWLNNQRSISCIPTGSYSVVKRTSDKYGTHFQLLNVPDRSMILIHSGNYYTQTQGCILVGSGYQDINQDNVRDIIESKNTLVKLYAMMPDKFDLKII
ncbi:MAG: DUF5675 family protein [Mariniphaga sp.]